MHSGDLGDCSHLSPDLRLPDFFIVGQPKCGTTALYEILRSHPDIYMPDLKEPDFFSLDLPCPWRPQTLTEYASLFHASTDKELVGEASVLYLFSRVAATHIADIQPTAKIIAIVREPVSLLQSLHLQFVQNHDETVKDLRGALALEADRRHGQRIPRPSVRPQILQYSEHVRYVRQLQRYHEVFPADQILVLIYDDFRNDGAATITKVLQFLKVDHEVSVSNTNANPTVRLRSRHLDTLVDSIAAGSAPLTRAVKAVVTTLTPQEQRRRVLQAVRQNVVYGRPTPLDEELAMELRRRFKPEVVALSEYIGRDLLTLWGYNNVK
jgi:hypothetical protein